MMKATLVSVDEYLRSSYHPDCDYVDGELVERNVGEKDHGKLQGAIYVYYYTRMEQTGVHPFIEQRLRISSSRYRVPDICLMIGEPPEEVFTFSPFVAIEVLSPEDRMSRMRLKIDDYLRIGVRYIWLIDPKTHSADVYTPEGDFQAIDGILRTVDPDTELPLNEIFDKIERR